MLMRTFVAFIFSLILTLVATPLVRQAAVKLKIMDHPNKRKVHRVPIPRLGGVAVFIAWCAAIAVALLFPLDHKLASIIVPVMIYGLLIVLLGVWDDCKDLPGKAKLLGQVVAASLVFFSGLRIDRITNPLGGEIAFPWPLSFLITLLWIVGMINAMNLIDGLDGLASGIVAIACIGLMAAGMYLRGGASLIVLAALMGGCLGFLRYNFYPAQIFLGDSGSQFLGFVLAASALLEHQYKAAAAVALLIPLMALALPIFDTALAFFRRIRWRKSIFQADKYHLHHRLLRMGLSHRQVVLFFYLVCSYLSLMSFLFVLIKDRYALVLLMLLALGFFLAMETLRFVELKFLAFRRRTFKQSHAKVRAY